MCTPEPIETQVRTSSSLPPEQDSLQNFQTTFEQAAVGIAHVGLDGRFMQVNQKLCDLVAIIREVVEDQRATTPNRSITLDVQVSEPLLVMVDHDRIGQVVSNYLANALKYSGEEINVGIVCEKNAACVWVRDHGSGLTMQQQQQIWERFYQVPGIPVQSGSGVGLGLGLYICQMLIVRHDGRVGVDSIPGQGSTFWFTIPMVE